MLNIYVVAELVTALLEHGATAKASNAESIVVVVALHEVIRKVCYGCSEITTVYEKEAGKLRGRSEFRGFVTPP